MPQPGLGTVHVNRPLTNISVAYLQTADMFIASKVFPRVPVPNKSDQYYTYPKEYWHRSEARKRAPGTESAGSGWSQSTATFDCDVIAVHKDIDDQIARNADAPLDLERDATQWVTHQLLIKQEVDWVGTFFAASTWTGSTTGADITVGSTWDVDSSTPIEDVSAQTIAITKNTGRKPNTLVIGPEVLDALRHHPDILDRIKYTQRGVVTVELLAALFDVERVLVPYAVQNTAAEGAASATMAYLYGKNALLVYTPSSPGLLTPAGGYTFTWTGYLGNSPSGMAITRWYEQRLKATRVEGEMVYDHKVVAADVGAYFASCVA